MMRTRGWIWKTMAVGALVVTIGAIISVFRDPFEYLGDAVSASFETYSPSRTDRRRTDISDPALMERIVNLPLREAVRIDRPSNREDAGTLTLRYSNGSREDVIVFSNWREAYRPFKGALALDLTALRDHLERADQ
jgi:hypothetical protein